MPSSACSLSRRLLPSFPTRRSSDLLVFQHFKNVEIQDLTPNLVRALELQPDVDEVVRRPRAGVLEGQLVVALADILDPRVERMLGLRSEEHTSELQSPCNLVCRLLLARSPAVFFPLSLHDALPIFLYFNISKMLKYKT